MTYITFDDPVSPGTVSIYAEPDQTYEDIEYLAALLWSLAITHQFECGKVARMAWAKIFCLDPVEAALSHNKGEYDPEKEWRDRIEEARWDAQRLRELREEGGSLDEVFEIMERARAGLEELMARDPARAEKIAAFLDASAQRIRKMIVDHNREVLKQRALARRKERREC